MTRMLASVNSLEEALLVQQAGVAIIDLKQPERGALGALDLDTVREIVQKINTQTPISATVGDLEMQPELVFDAVKKMAETGVDYVKIGFFPNGDILATLEKLRILTEQGIALIAVLFADAPLDLSLLAALKKAGFTGVMLDTMEKKSGSLTQLMTVSQLQDFVTLAHQMQFLCGLAGSLRKKDIPVLLPLKADYLGFRGALCRQHNRAGQLDFIATLRIKQAMR